MVVVNFFLSTEKVIKNKENGLNRVLKISFFKGLLFILFLLKYFHSWKIGENHLISYKDF